MYYCSPVREMFLRDSTMPKTRSAHGEAEASFCGLGATGNATLRIPWSILEIVLFLKGRTWEYRIAGMDHGVVLVGGGAWAWAWTLEDSKVLLQQQYCTVGMSYYCGSILVRAILCNGEIWPRWISRQGTPSPSPTSHRRLQGVVEHSRAQPAKSTLRTVDSVTTYCTAGG